MKTLSILLLSLIYAPLTSVVIAFTPSHTRFTLKAAFRVAKPISIELGPRHPSHVRVQLSDDDEPNQFTNSDSSPTLYTPADRPVLAVIDVIGLIIFAFIGKSSHSADGSIDVVGVLSTAFPFVTSWLASSPLTGVYSPDERGGDTNVISSTAIKVAKGWALAVPLGIAMRGVLKGYVPPVPFIIVTMISTLVILAGIRLLFNVVENFFVELV
jgi:hypothetical protein